MEDHNKSKVRAASGDAESIVELTPGMELPDQTNIRIIDLTDAVDNPSGFPASSPEIDPSVTEPTSGTEKTLPNPPDDEIPPGNIEQEVDAAFDAVQEPAAPMEESNEALFNRLSDIPRRVDNALDPDFQKKTQPEALPAMPIKPSAPDDENLAIDAAEVESALAGYAHDGQDDEIVELTDIVEPEELSPSDFQLEDEIIELTDIVDPAELQVSAAENQDDGEILELTDIVDPAEPAAMDADPSGEAEALAIKEMVDPAELEEGLAGNEIVEPEDFQPEIDEAPIVDPIGAMAPHEGEESLPEEGMVRLSDVLSPRPPEEEGLPVEQIKMGAEEDTAGAPGPDLDHEIQNENNMLTEREIEAAVERIIQKKYAATIEQLIARTVEKAVTREIENIKRAMMDGDEPLA